MHLHKNNFIHWFRWNWIISYWGSIFCVHSGLIASPAANVAANVAADMQPPSEHIWTGTVNSLRSRTVEARYRTELVTDSGSYRKYWLKVGFMKAVLFCPGPAVFMTRSCQFTGSAADMLVMMMSRGAWWYLNTFTEEKFCMIFLVVNIWGGYLRMWVQNKGRIWFWWGLRDQKHQ